MIFLKKHCLQHQGSQKWYLLVLIIARFRFDNYFVSCIHNLDSKSIISVRWIFLLSYQRKIMESTICKNAKHIYGTPVKLTCSTEPFSN